MGLRRIGMNRDLTEKETEEFNLYYSDGTVMKPMYEGYTEVFTGAINGFTPYYKIYNFGTNHVKVLLYEWRIDSWAEIKFDEIHNLHGLVWRLLCRIEQLEYEQG